MNKLKVLVLDDHPLMRIGLSDLLNSQPDMEVAGEAENAREALEMAGTIPIDVAILDLAMPDRSGIDVARQFKREAPQIKIVVFSMFEKEAYVLQALKAGATAYVLKGAENAHILQAIRAVWRGEYYFCSGIQREAAEAFLNHARGDRQVEPYDLLSGREQEVFRLLVEGKSVRASASLLDLHPKTVEKHMSNIMKKLNCHSRLSLVKYAIKVGVLNPELWKN